MASLVHTNKVKRLLILSALALVLAACGAAKEASLEETSDKLSSQIDDGTVSEESLVSKLSAAGA